VERDAGLGVIRALIETAAHRGRLLALEGEPGIGKTSLISKAKARANEAGMQVLAARGSELERTFAYGVVRQLFEPFVARLRAEERAELLRGPATAIPIPASARRGGFELRH
jgi:predicted ATPase